MSEKKFRFTAEETVSNTISKLRRESEELGRGLIRDARAYTTSGKEALAYIENQIRAIEKRNKADKQSQTIQAETQRDSGKISQTAFKERIKQIGVASKADEQQVILLRELIDAVKNTSKREIIEDRKGVEKKIKSDKQVDMLSPKGEAFDILKKTLQRQELGNIKSQEQDEKDRFKGIRAVGETINRTGATAAGSRNEFFMAASLMAAIPIVGDALSGLASRAFSSAQQMQTNRGRLYGVTGGIEGSAGTGAIGLTGATFGEFYELQKQAAIAKAGGRGAGLAAENVMMLERLGIGRGALLGQERLGVGGASGSMGATENLVRNLQASGAIKGQDFSVLNEYFDLSLQLQREQLRVSGETNDNITGKLVAGISSIDDSFKNPDVLRGLVPSITGALSRPQTAQAEAFQFGILRRMKPGASLSQLQEMREAPTMELMQQTLQEIQRLYPNEEMGVQITKGLFGLEGQTALARKLYRGNVNLSNYENQQGIINLRSRVGSSTGELEGRSASWDREFEQMGDDIVGYVTDKVTTYLGKESEFGKFVTDFKDGTKEFVTGVNKFISEIPILGKMNDIILSSTAKAVYGNKK